ncbi:MAG: alkaline phosphatase family protein, partial [Acidobacteria bacterium]|nr:alkaline phosphatase family protein [Acidobacteriota bacterium]
MGSFAACSHIGPAAPASPVGEGKAEGPVVPRLAPGARRLLLVMVDGLPVELFESTLLQGGMPHLQELFARRPTVISTALSTFPSSTSPSLPEMLSGRYAEVPDPDEPGMVHAFDREERRVVRYFTQPDAWQWSVPDLFTAAAAGGLPALTVAEGRWEGAESVLTRGAVLRDAALEFMGVQGPNGDRGPVEELVRRIRGPQPPVVILLVLNSVDLAGHLHGPDTVLARQALEESDELLGKVIDALAGSIGGSGRRLLDDTTVLLFGDHGMVPSGTFLDLQPIFQARGLSTFDTGSLTQVAFRERLGSLWTRWPDVLLVGGGSNVTQIYFRRPSGAWQDGEEASAREERRGARSPASEAFAAELVHVPGVAQVLRNLPDGRIEIIAFGGRLAWVERRGEGHERRFAYTVPAGAKEDPLDYLSDPATRPLVCRSGEEEQSCFRSRLEWQLATAAARFPGVVPLLHKALGEERFSGDLVVTALPGYSFLKGQEGDHGNFERVSMTTPFVANGPGVLPMEDVPLIRLVDVYPTAAVLLGADPLDPVLASLDGR